MEKTYCNYPEKLYYACPELQFEILELQKSEEFDDCCIYKYNDETFEIDFYGIVEFAKQFAEEDGEEYEDGQNFSSSYDEITKVAIKYLNDEIDAHERSIAIIKNKIFSLS